MERGRERQKSTEDGQKIRERELGVWPIVMVLQHRGEKDRGVEGGEERQRRAEKG